jgi:hypothetical protein
MKIALIILAFVFVFGCATEQETIKPATNPVTSVAVVKLPQKEVKDVLHFVTFRSDPPGAGIYVIDSQTGKEVGSLGTTPVRILLMKKKVEIEGFYVNCTGINPNAAGLTLVGKTGKTEQIEFQFKYKLQGFYDEIKIERLLLNTSSDTDVTLNMSMIIKK